MSPRANVPESAAALLTDRLGAVKMPVCELAGPVSHALHKVSRNTSLGSQTLGSIMLYKTVEINSQNKSASTHLLVASLLSALCLAQLGCTSRSDSTAGKREFISVGTAPAGGAFYTVGSAICEVVNENRGELNWRVNAESTGGSMENIRLLSQGKLQFAMSLMPAGPPARRGRPRERFR